MKKWLVGIFILAVIGGWFSVRILANLRQATAESLVVLVERKANAVKLPPSLRRSIITHAEARGKDISAGTVSFEQAISWIQNLQRGPLSLAFLLTGIRTNLFPGDTENDGRQLAILGRFYQAAKAGKVPSQTVAEFSRPWLTLTSTEVRWPSGLIFLDDQPVLAGMTDPGQIASAIAVAASFVQALPDRPLPGRPLPADPAEDSAASGFPDLLNEFAQAENHRPPASAFLSRQENIGLMRTSDPPAASKTLVLAYQDFGPQVAAHPIIGMEWWQWDKQGSPDPTFRYDIKVVVYEDIPLEQVKREYPVDREKMQDYRYLSYANAMAYLNLQIQENVVLELTQKLRDTKARIEKNLKGTP